LLGTLAAIALMVVLLHDILLPFVAGIALAYLLDPSVERIERLGLISRAPSISQPPSAPCATLGDIKQKRGDLGGALQSYQGTIPIVSRLAKSDPAMLYGSAISR
jgi:hypothetical protein